ncbi:MAG: N-6 DNA methylase, partial [Oligoflexia bacterium]|nr:N-6 DNA methylase [Oligoflexia bacterium]
MSSNLAHKILQIRQNLSLSQEELAEKLGVSFATVNRWENGHSAPRKTVMETIHRLYETAQSEDVIPQKQKRNVVRGKNRGGGLKMGILDNSSMEQMLWQAACKIRGEKDAPKFKDYILPLLFIKRLSDVFDDEVKRLVQKFGSEKQALKILEMDPSLVRFYLPPETRWSVVSGREDFKPNGFYLDEPSQHSNQGRSEKITKNFNYEQYEQPHSLGEQLTLTMRSIVKANSDKNLRGVIDVVDYNETRGGEREISDSALRGIIQTFSKHRLGLNDVEPDFLGRSYEYLLRKFAEGQGQSSGEFFTPREVGFIMAKIMQPMGGETAYDYACGSFGLLIKLQLVLKKIDPLNKTPLRLYGQELNSRSFAIACMNRIIHDMEGEVQLGNSMENPKFRDSSGKLKKFDIILANPMWNQPIDNSFYENDPFDRFEAQGGITSSKADWAWLQHTLACLKEDGRAAVVLDTGAVTRGSGSQHEDKERKIRKWFVDNDLIEGVILLPEWLLDTSEAAD